ncbi:MAG TPA: hypothetical protein VGQ44_22390 [Gemmatimonadaceae bacterium]|jgi:hypothetical protein|nr:hypothetical protein [Gemmatimonadaceae bacterium]
MESSEGETATYVDSSQVGWSEQWRDALGPFWKWQLMLIGVLLFTAGTSLPLADPDLPMHLATGEWIARHHAVPFTEPFAWTRAGAPFQAYSWAIELLYFELMAHVGPIGLGVLQGITYVALAAVMLVLGRVARWNPWVVLVMVAGNLIVTLGTTPYVRPQSILLIATPLAWALVYRALDTRRLGLTLVGLLAVSTVLSNTHLLFPIALIPCVLLLTKPPADRKRMVLVPAAIVLGWFLSPYALHWPEIFALNFAKNAVLGPPSGINEYKPGFQMLMTGIEGSTVVGVLLAFLPWVAAKKLDARERFFHGGLWLAGLLLFALALRSLVVWWLVTIPMSAVALSLARTPAVPVVRTAQRAIVLVIFALVAAAGLETWEDPALRAGDANMRYVPSINAKMIEPLVRWIECNTRPTDARLVTMFNFGGYFPWRLPRLSESIDGRTIFPDSVARAETYFSAFKPEIPLQPWRTADVAIFPVKFPVAAVLDTARGWHRVAMTNQLDGPSRMIGVWVTDDWWQRAGIGPVPRRVLPVMQSLDPRHTSCEALVPLPQSKRTGAP